MSSTYEWIIRTVSSQDVQQKVGVLFSVSVEMFRVLVSSMLILFVPQKCGDHICGVLEDIVLTDINDENTIGIIINFATMAVFITMYVFEIRRENELIRVLEVNNNISTDPDSVGKRLEVLAQYKIDRIHDMNMHYKYACFFSIFMFTLNTAYSGRIIYKYTLGNQTSLNFVTNILFMFSKLSDVLLTVNTGENVFYSAYLTTKVQFNDIDPRELVKIERNRLLNMNLYPTTIPKKYTHVCHDDSVQKMNIDMAIELPPMSDTSSDDLEKKMVQAVFREPALYSDDKFVKEYIHMSISNSNRT